jgi:ribosomal protein L11 methyltransferase
MLELFPTGFEEVELEDGSVELAAYAPSEVEERFWSAFGPGQAREVQAGWEEGWKRFHRPVRVGPLWVGPPWLEPDADASAVFIDPGRAFGTGAHATTRLCLELLLTRERGSLADLGCGSGVLAIAAAKLGFAPVLAFDVDDVAVAVARDNARANGVEVTMEPADVLRDRLPETDGAVANIALGPVEELAPVVDTRWLVTSGYLASERPAADGWNHVERREGESWAADLLERVAP